MKSRFVSPKFEKFIRAGFKAEDFSAQFVNEKWMKPKFSLRMQADIRKATSLLGLDHVQLGIPALEPRKEFRHIPEGTKYQKNYLERKAKVDKALQNMPKTISKWKEEIEKENAKKISNLPF